MTGAPLVLVTNDDGVHARGLRAAAVAVRAAGAVPLVVAPSQDRSVTGTALGGGFGSAPLRAERVVWSGDGLDDVAVYQMPTYPAALTTLVAAGAFGRRPDLVLAGINHGVNTGVGVLHSGTVGSALTGGLAGIPAAAVSVVGPPERVDWTGCQRFVAVLLAVLRGGVPPSGALNVNLPARPPSDPGRIGWRVLATTGTTVARLERCEAADRSVDLRMRFEPVGETPPAGTDSGALLRGEASLTWLSLPHGRPAPAGWQRRTLRRLRAGWAGTDADPGTVPGPTGPHQTAAVPGR
ncbi:5'/3'-nucleotidase SurE [Rugosimonospora africana]|uniref:5'-nucleotidase n=1 Tax=Rugosimonospora africana TaxID=556532 RepID=A0A8J3QZU6_9ACTN|nr:5'/3'-nucleotidase SurE [Rugosimonospora africana]GIH19636.1 5'/3'-nucleotidase SurE [Rugosimonospora africana]